VCVCVFVCVCVCVCAVVARALSSPISLKEDDARREDTDKVHTGGGGLADIFSSAGAISRRRQQEAYVLGSSSLLTFLSLHGCISLRPLLDYFVELVQRPSYPPPVPSYPLVLPFSSLCPLGASFATGTRASGSTWCASLSSCSAR